MELASSTIKSSAPGKLVLAGEYAVLAGGVGLAIAVDRRAECRIRALDSGGWVFRTHDDGWWSQHTRSELSMDLPREDPARMVRLLCDPYHLPEHGEMVLDSSDFYTRGTKLGVGSSAATLVAMGAALDVLLKRSRNNFDELIRAHGRLQGGSGSGIDVATAWHGGAIAYRRGVVTNLSLSPAIHFRFVWSGHSTNTSEMIARFDSWRRRDSSMELSRLCASAENVVATVSDAEAFVAAMGKFGDIMSSLDQAAELGYWGAVHKRIRSLSASLGLPYKPSGAGGGDMGIACSTNPDVLDEFDAALVRQQIQSVQLRVTPHGAQSRIE